MTPVRLGWNKKETKMSTGTYARALAAAALLGTTILATGAAAETVRIAYGDIASMEGIPVLAALERAKERGVDIELTFVQSKEIAGQVVASGQADIGIGIPYAIIQNVGAPMRMFLQMSRLAYYPIVNSEVYTSWADLDGEEVAVQSRGSGTEAIMVMLAEANGISFSNITYVPGSEVRAGALLQGVINASIVDAANRDLLMTEAPGKFLLLPMDDVSATDEGLFANVEFLEREAEAVDIIVEEVLRTFREVAEDPSAAVSLREQYDLLPDLPEDAIASIVPYFTEIAEVVGVPVNGGGEEAARDDIRFFALSGQLTGDPDTLATEDFWDLAPLNRVLDKIGAM